MEVEAIPTIQVSHQQPQNRVLDGQSEVNFFKCRITDDIDTGV